MEDKITSVSKDILDRNKELYGDNIAKCYAVEEMAELAKELIKDIRGIGNRENIIEEIADVYYTLSMVMQENNISSEVINSQIEFKQSRARKAMGIVK